MEAQSKSTEPRTLKARQAEKRDQTVETSTPTTASQVTNKQREPLTAGKPIERHIALNRIYAKALAAENDFQISVVQFDDESSYTPNSYKLFEILSQTNDMVYQNDNLHFILPRYLTMPVQIYYGILTYLQIVRVRVQAKIATKNESRWYRALTRHYKEETLPIAGPLIPFFEGIVPYKPDDKQYPIIYPTLPKEAIYSTTITSGTTEVKVNPAYHLLPAIPIMLDIFKQFCQKATIESSDFDTEGNYVPFQLTNGGSLGGINFEKQSGEEMLSEAKAQILSNPGLAFRAPEDQARLSELNHYWQKSRAKEIPTPSSTEAFSPETIEHLMMMSEDITWFEIMIEAALEHSTFFNETTNLSEIKTVGTNQVKVQINFETNDYKERPTAIKHWYTDHGKEWK